MACEAGIVGCVMVGNLGGGLEMGGPILDAAIICL